MLIVGYVLAGCAFLLVIWGQGVLAHAVQVVRERHPAEFKTLSGYGLTPLKGFSNDDQRARRGLAGPMLTGRLPGKLREDTQILALQRQWRMCFGGILGCMVLFILIIATAG